MGFEAEVREHNAAVDELEGNFRALGRPGKSMQAPSQIADLDGQPWIGQVHGHAINPPVQPKPATTMIGGQLMEESPTPAGQAARQPDTGRVQARGEGYFRAYRLLQIPRTVL